MTLAHFGVAIVIMGITVSATWQVEKQQVMKPGESIDVGPYRYTFVGAGPSRGPNYTALRGEFRVTRDGNAVTTLFPATRRFTQPLQETTEAATRTSLYADLYAVIGQPEAGGGFATRLYFKPLVSWIWFGALVMVFGGLMSLSDRRHRVGAPKKAASARPKAGEAKPA